MCVCVCVSGWVPLCVCAIDGGDGQDYDYDSRRRHVAAGFYGWTFLGAGHNSSPLGYWTVQRRWPIDWIRRHQGAMLICAMPYRHGIDTGAVSVLSLITVNQISSCRRLEGLQKETGS